MLTLPEILTAIKCLEIDTDSALSFFKAQKEWKITRYRFTILFFSALLQLRTPRRKWI